MEWTHVIEAVTGGGILAVAAAIANHLKTIGLELHGIKTALAVTQTTLTSHTDMLEKHDERIRSLESCGRKG